MEGFFKEIRNKPLILVCGLKLKQELTSKGTPMKQISFSNAEYAGKRKKTQRKNFLAEMRHIMPWSSLLKLIESVFRKS